MDDVTHGEEIYRIGFGEAVEKARFINRLQSFDPYFK
jgi:predicted helicase